MNILNKEAIENIQLAEVDFKASANEYEFMLRKLLQPGVVLRWRTRGYVQRGIVVLFTGNAHYPDVRVENEKTGKVVRIDVRDVDWDLMLRLADTYEKEFKALEAI